MRNFIKFCEEEYEQELLVEVIEEYDEIYFAQRAKGDEYHDKISYYIRGLLDGYRQCGYSTNVTEITIISEDKKEGYLKEYLKEYGELILDDFDDNINIYKNIFKQITNNDLIEYLKGEII